VLCFQDIVFILKISTIQQQMCKSFDENIYTLLYLKKKLFVIVFSFKQLNNNCSAKNICEQQGPAVY
jgi:hypothetical protein